MNDLKIVYMGTPEFGLPALEAINSIYNVIAGSLMFFLGKK